MFPVLCHFSFWSPVHTPAVWSLLHFRGSSGGLCTRSLSEALSSFFFRKEFCYSTDTPRSCPLQHSSLTIISAESTSTMSLKRSGTQGFTHGLFRVCLMPHTQSICAFVMNPHKCVWDNYQVVLWDENIITQ